MTAMARPSQGLFDVTTTLSPFAIITYAVDPDKLTRLLPQGTAADVFQLASGRHVAFVSAVPFVDRDFALGLAPWYRLSFSQINYRAYVKLTDGKRAVFFFGTSITSRWVVIPRYVWRLPWHRASIDIATRPQASGATSLVVKARGAFGACDYEGVVTAQPMGLLDGFADAAEAAVVLTDPFDGYYVRRDGCMGTYSIWHPKLELVHLQTVQASFSVFEERGLVQPGTPPHSALMLDQTDFLIRLPPRKLTGPALLKPESAAPMHRAQSAPYSESQLR